MSRAGEMHLTAKPNSSVFTIPLPHKFSQTPRIRYSIRIDEKDAFALIHHLCTIGPDAFTLAVFNQYEAPVSFDIYWDAYII